jgi:hypothetical protein
MKQVEDDEEEEAYRFPVTGFIVPLEQYYPKGIINGEKTGELHEEIIRCPRHSHV